MKINQNQSNAYRRSTKNQPKSTKNQSKINQKSTKNQPKWCPGAFQGGSWKQVGARISAVEFLWGHFGATWPILDDFGGPLKSKGAPKTSQKIQYGDFWASGSGPGSAKSCFWRVLENASIFEWIFNGFWLHFGSVFGWFFMFFSLPFRGCFFNDFL